MIKYLKTEPWLIIEEGFEPKHHRSSESIFSLGNGTFGQRANHEEKYSGPTLQGSYVAGVYYPDKTRVGWWKNGYPEYFAKVLNSTNWIGIDITIDGEELDLAKVEVSDFRRVLNMKEGTLTRTFIAQLNQPLLGNRDGGEAKMIKVEVVRFCSMDDYETAAINYSITPLNFSGDISFTPYLDGDVKNHDSNYDEKFWTEVSKSAGEGEGVLVTRTKKTEFELAVAMQCSLSNAHWTKSSEYSKVSTSATVKVDRNTTIVFHKYVGIVSSLNYDAAKCAEAAMIAAKRAKAKGFDAMLAAHIEKWERIWELADIRIDGDAEAQQGIRFNIFHLNQTYTGEDARLNIGPKGFTGEKYGGSTYWDTEAYCIPFYMATKDQKVARQLLVYRYNQLGKAIENAEKLGFTNGAALYPMVTMNGEECHNEWEITFEEIHRNGAIAFAIFNYIKYTTDEAYMADSGWDVLLGIARFWSQRITWSEEKQQYVMLGVTGPNEYENNVNNNWYTSYIATWCLSYCMEGLEWLKKNDAEALAAKTKKYQFDENETTRWKDIIAKMYYPKKAGSNTFLQQDGFLDKELRNASSLDPKERPINQHWSWDRILRSCFIKQADVLQGLYLFEDHFTSDVIKENFDFYEPMTVHESSLSPCVHSILAAKLGYEEKAYEMYLRTARLDIDDYNHEAHEGLHITSMAGTWMSVVQGFGGMRLENGELTFNAMLPKQWKGFAFNVLFRGKRVHVEVTAEGTKVSTH
jgi:maltose phosphorylase